MDRIRWLIRGALLFAAAPVSAQTFGEVMAACQNDISTNVHAGGGCDTGRTWQQECAVNTELRIIAAMRRCGSDPWIWNGSQWSYSGPVCPEGQEWSDPDGDFFGECVDVVQQCELPAGTTTASGINATGIPPGAAGCDRASNCATTFQSTDYISLQGNSYRGGKFVTTGATCDADDDEQGPDDVEDKICRQVDGGMEICISEDETCVTSPRGTKFCWPKEDNPPDRCETESQGADRDAICVGQPEAPEPEGDGEGEDEWDRRGGTNVSRGGNTTNIDYNVCIGCNSNSDDEEEEDEPDCPANDPNCEDDDDSDITAADSGCETETPSCSDTSAVDCQILYRTHRTKCEIAHTNKLIAEFRDKQLAEARETNAKIKALAQIQKDILEQHGVKLDEQKTVTTEVKVAVADSATAITTAINEGRTALVSELQGINEKLTRTTGATPSLTCATAPACGGDPIACAQLVQTWFSRCGGTTGTDPGQPEWTQPGTHEAGEGVTTADAERTGVTATTLDVGDVDTGGFLGGGSCPALPQLSIGASSVDIDPAVWCDFLAMLKVVFSIAGAWAAVQILTR